VGVWDHARLEPARPDLQLTPQCVPVVIGTPRQIEELNEILVIYDANPNPVLVIGGGKVGRAAARALKRRGIPVHVVERKGELESKIRGIPDRLVMGDAHDDAANIYLTVYCRRLSPDARILTRVTHERNIEAIRRAGADFVLSYASLGVQTVYSIVRGREIVVLGEDVNLFYLKVPPSLEDKTLAEAGIGARTGLNVIAIQQNGRVTTELPRGLRLPTASELVVLGSTEQRVRFRETYR
jgi:Trk K+ transport system NAD-binding subunit